MLRISWKSFILVPWFKPLLTQFTQLAKLAQLVQLAQLAQFDKFILSYR